MTHEPLEHLLDGLKIALGHFDTYRLPTGEAVVKPRSISFAKMDQVSFGQFYDRALRLILTRILPRMQRSDLEARIHDILEGAA